MPNDDNGIGYLRRS